MLKFLFFIVLPFLPISMFAQAKAEKISAFWPTEEHLVFEGKEKKGDIITEYYLPKKSSRIKWSLLGTIKTYKNLVTPYNDSTWVAYEKLIHAHSAEAVITLLEKNTTTKTYWYIYKVEAMFNQKQLRQESAIFFAKQGKYNFFEVSVTYPDREFPEGFVEKWTTILKKSEIYYDF